MTDTDNATEDGGVMLPGATNAVPEEIQELVDGITNSDKVLRFISDPGDGEKTYHVMHAYDEQGDPVFAAHLPNTFRRLKMVNRGSVIHTLKDSIRGKILSPDELTEELSSWHEDIADYGNPLDEVYVFVKRIDDGRYKDEWKLERGGSEQEIRDRGGWLGLQSDADDVTYHCAGTVREVIYEEIDLPIDPDFKKRVTYSPPEDLRYMVEGKLHERIRDSLEVKE